VPVTAEGDAMFDELPDGDPHGECAAEIRDLKGLLLWALWHNLGASSPVGRPIRAALGIEVHDALTPEQIHAGADVAARVMRVKNEI
jgi:hypothetical protein